MLVAILFTSSTLLTSETTIDGLNINVSVFEVVVVAGIVEVVAAAVVVVVLLKLLL